MDFSLYCPHFLSWCQTIYSPFCIPARHLSIVHFPNVSLSKIMQRTQKIVRCVVLSRGIWFLVPIWVFQSQFLIKFIKKWLVGFFRRIRRCPIQVRKMRHFSHLSHDHINYFCGPATLFYAVVRRSILVCRPSVGTVFRQVSSTGCGTGRLKSTLEAFPKDIWWCIHNNGCILCKFYSQLRFWFAMDFYRFPGQNYGMQIEWNTNYKWLSCQ